VKFWLIIFFLTPEGEFISKKEISYKDKTACYVAMDRVKVKQTTQMVCVSNDHYTGRKQDPGIPYD
jgi:hypothetical protein